MRHSKACMAAVTTLMLSASAAIAANVHNCEDYTSNARSLAEPWEKNTRTFVNGSVRIALIDTGGEPACCSTHLLVLAEDKSDETGGRMCRVISDRTNIGYEWIDFSKIIANYNPSRGLQLAVPVNYYIDGVRHRSEMLRVSVNLQKGVIAAH